MSQGWIPVKASYSVMGDIDRGHLNECATCGSIVPYCNQTQHTNFHKTFTNRKDGNMSKVLWCDRGNHAFKAGAPGSLHMDGSTVDGDGKHHDESMDACAEHNPMRVRPDVIVKELNQEFPVNGGVTD